MLTHPQASGDSPLEQTAFTWNHVNVDNLL
ncbi:MAG: hypothetical protein JWO83_3892 [Caulobacteraceae bacterium]|nr:hypothetical protein [Caulobacteraceae bacterium]